MIKNDLVKILPCRLFKRIQKALAKGQVNKKQYIKRSEQNEDF
jgi:hypothetical protein